MNKQQHLERHVLLHHMLDELVADWISCGPSKAPDVRLPSHSSIMDLMDWSFKQTVNPELPPNTSYDKSEPTNFPVVVAFDVDGVLVDRSPDKNPEDMIMLMMFFKRIGAKIIVWSGGGVDYVQRRLSELTINMFVDEIRVKGDGADVDICFDDQDVSLAKVNIKV